MITHHAPVGGIVDENAEFAELELNAILNILNSEEVKQKENKGNARLETECAKQTSVLLQTEAISMKFSETVDEIANEKCCSFTPRWPTAEAAKSVTGDESYPFPRGEKSEDCYSQILRSPNVESVKSERLRWFCSDLPEIFESAKIDNTSLALENVRRIMQSHW